MSGWDILDRRFGRKPAPVTLQPLAEGDDCPAPRCRGTMKRWVAFWDDESLICNRCGWRESAGRAERPMPAVFCFSEEHMTSGPG